MKIFFLTLLIVPMEKVTASTHALDSTRLVQILQNLCPEVKVCRNNNTNEVSQRMLKPGTESCCTECSCGPDCLELNDCCFPAHSTPSKYPAEDPNSQTTAECIYPMTVQPVTDIKHNVQSYSMIVAVTQTKEINKYKKSTSKNFCGEEKVAPWGSLYPVYSPKRKQIYKNNVCAEADGVADGISWDAIIFCRRFDGDLYLDAGSFPPGIVSHFISGACSVEFAYRGDVEDLGPKECYIDPIDTCNTPFEVPETVNMTKNELKEACTSGLLSPFRNRKLYANVFCHICNAEYFSQDLFCKKKNVDIVKRTNNMKGFMALIDGDVITENLHDHPNEKATCPNMVNTDHCTTFCPSGKLLDRTGSCKFPTKLWFNQEYTVCINLTTDDGISLEDIFNFSRTHTQPGFETQWLHHGWVIYAVLYEEDGPTENVKHLVVMLKKNLREASPTRLITYVKQNANRDWILRHKNGKTVFRSSFSKRDISLSSYSEIDFLVGNTSIGIYRPKYQIGYHNNAFEKNELFITKLYMCNQIELIHPDFYHNQDKTVIFNTITARYLFEGEFVLIINPTFGDVRARVCIEDSGLYPSYPTSISTGYSLIETYSAWTVSISFLFVKVTNGFNPLMY